jgi:hypothetical protein
MRHTCARVDLAESVHTSGIAVVLRVADPEDGHRRYEGFSLSPPALILRNICVVDQEACILGVFFELGSEMFA